MLFQGRSCSIEHFFFQFFPCFAEATSNCTPGDGKESCHISNGHAGKVVEDQHLGVDFREGI